MVHTYENEHRVVDFDPEKDRLLHLNFTATNKSLTDELLGNPHLLHHYITQLLTEAGARYGIGGYREPRILYRRNSLFLDTASSAGEARSIHLGIDIWAAAGTAVYVPLAGKVHSFANNNQEGDYGATIIIEHKAGEAMFYTLYGHLSASSLQGLEKGSELQAGSLLGHFGDFAENGNWPPHLHFQLIRDMEGKSGDYPGVCKPSEQEVYVANCPDPDQLLQMMQYAV